MALSPDQLLSLLEFPPVLLRCIPLPRGAEMEWSRIGLLLAKAHRVPDVVGTGSRPVEEEILAEDLAPAPPADEVAQPDASPDPEDPERGAPCNRFPVLLGREGTSVDLRVVSRRDVADRRRDGLGDPWVEPGRHGGVLGPAGGLVLPDPVDQVAGRDRGPVGPVVLSTLRHSLFARTPPPAGPSPFASRSMGYRPFGNRTFGPVGGGPGSGGAGAPRAARVLRPDTPNRVWFSLDDPPGPSIPRSPPGPRRGRVTRPLAGHAPPRSRRYRPGEGGISSEVVGVAGEKPWATAGSTIARALAPKAGTSPSKYPVTW